MMEAAEIYAEVASERRLARAELQGEDPIPLGDRMIARLRQKGTFLVAGLELRFADDVWDLSPRSSKPGAKHTDKLPFDRAGSFADIARLYCFERLVKEETGIITIRNALMTVCRFLASAEQAGYDDIAAIPCSFYEEMRSRPAGIRHSTRSRYSRDLLSFLSFYERFFSPLRDRRVMRLLAERDTERIAAEQKANKTDVVEQGYLEELLYTCHEVANDEAGRLDNRIVACCLMMYSQIGCRTEELGTFKAGAIRKLEGKGRGPDLWHADFKFSKRKGSRWEWTPTTCYLDDFALEAFRLLEVLCADARDAAGTDALVVFDGGVRFNKGAFSGRYHKFVIDCLAQPPFLNCPDRRNGMKAKRAAEAAWGPNSWLKKRAEKSGLAALAERGLEEDDMLTYPEIRMFRNTVCTSLYLQRVDLKWIGMHLNHLCKEMEAYYNRADREIDRAFSNEVYRSVVETGARVVGPNGDAFMERIDTFLEKKGHLANIEAGPEAIIEKLSSKYPLKKKRLGMCIRCAGVAPCAVDEVTDEVTCAQGVCPNHCSMWWCAPGTYAELKDAERAVKANLDRGRVKEAQHELAKMRNVLEARFARELAELDRMLNEHGAEVLLAEHPELADIISRRDDVWKEVEAWRSWQL